MIACRLLAFLCLLGIVGCTKDDSSSDIMHNDLIGHWNISVLSGLQFIEFTPNNGVLIDDRGAIGVRDISKHYLQQYNLKDNVIIDLPSGARMEDVVIHGNRMTFTFVNPAKNYSQPYTAYNVSMSDDLGPKVNTMAQAWITTTENGRPLKPAYQKVAYFSKVGIYALKSLKDENVQLFNWHWGNSTGDQICYQKYQRPTLVPELTCMNFGVLTNSEAVFEVQGDIIEMVSTSSF